MDFRLSFEILTVKGSRGFAQIFTEGELYFGIGILNHNVQEGGTMNTTLYLL